MLFRCIFGVKHLAGIGVDQDRTFGSDIQVRAAAAYAGLVSRLSPSVCKFVLNGFCREKKLDLDLLTDSVGLSLAGIVPESGEMRLCLEKGEGLKRGTARGAFERIADRICGRHIPLPDLRRI